MKHSTFLIGLLAAILSLLSVQTAQAGEKLTISDASAHKSDGTEWAAYSGSISNVKDGSTTTRYWSSSNQASGNYIKIELADLSVLESVTLRFHSSDDQAQNAAIEYSTDGTVWTRAVEFTSSNITSGVYSYNFTNTPTAKYLRMIITQESDKWLIMYEFEVYGPETNLTDIISISDAPTGEGWADNTHWYKIKNGKGSYLSSSYLKENTTHLRLDDPDDPGEDGYWCIVGDETNGYSFYNYATGKILEMTADGTAEGSVYAQLADPSATTSGLTTKFDISSSSYRSGSAKWWNVKDHGSSNAYWTQHGNSQLTNVYNCLAYWYSNSATSDQGSAFTFEAVSLSDISCTINYNGGEGYVFTRSVTKSPGATLTLEDVRIPYYKDFVFADASNFVVSTTNKDFTVNCTPDFPFVEGWAYKLYAGANNTAAQCFTYSASDGYAKYTGIRTSVDANSYWTFEHISGTENQFYVYNLGAQKYMFLTDSRATAQFGAKDESKTNYSNRIRITPNVSETETGFNLQHVTGTSCCGAHITESSAVGTWKDNASNVNIVSRIFLYDIKSELAALGNDPVTEGTYVGETTSPRLISTAAAAGTTPTVANVEACLDAKNNPTLADYVTAEKYYQIFFVSSDNTTNKALTLNNAIMNYNSGDGSFSLEISNTAMAVDPVAEASLWQTDFIASLYTLTAGTTGMIVKNVNANVPWGAVITNYGLIATTGAGTEYPFAVVSGQSDNSRWNIQTGNGYLAFNSADYESVIVNNTTSGTTARLKEVTSIPVTIKSTLWTSLCFPVDVVIPANLKAYKAASTQGMTINLEELAAGSRIPAGTGFLALADAKTYTDGAYTFAIATGSEAVADLSGNQFTGAKVKRSGMADVEYFALATKNEVTGFYKVTTGTVPANKAYLLGEKLNQGAGANMLQFAFGEGTETGISNVNAENSGKAETYYDLNGRLVVYPTRGVYVTGSGRKVFVK